MDQPDSKFQLEFQIPDDYAHIEGNKVPTTETTNRKGMYEIAIYYNSEIFHIPTFIFIHSIIRLMSAVLNSTIRRSLLNLCAYFLPISLPMHKTTKYRTSITHSVRQKGITIETSDDFNYIDHIWDGQYGLLYPYYHTVTLIAIDSFHYTSH